MRCQWFAIRYLSVAGLLVLALKTASAEAQPFVYAVTQSTNSVSVIDVSTNTVCATDPVGNTPYGVAISPDGTLAYVTNLVVSSNSVSVIGRDPTSCVSDNIVTTVPEGGNPINIAVTPDRTRAYVAEFGGSNVSVIDTVNNSIIATIPVGPFSFGGIAVTPDGSGVWVAYGLFGSTVAVIDSDPASPTYNTVVDQIAVGLTAVGMAFAPDGTRSYVTNSNSNSISVIDTATHHVTATISVGLYPYEIAITPDGTLGYVAINGADAVSVIDTDPSSPTYNTALTTIPVGRLPIGVAISPDGTSVYVTNNGSSSISVINTSNNVVVATIAVDANPWGVAVSPF
jgi:YVTN family beta-propeller protein